MSRAKPFDQALAALASMIAEQASGPDVELVDRIDAFKALTPYYIGDTKLKGKKDEDDDESQTFKNFQKKIAAVK